MDKIKFEISVFKGDLVLSLIIEKTVIASLSISKEQIDDIILKDFMLFIKYNVITFAINNEENKDENVFTIDRKITAADKEIVANYMGIPILYLKSLQELLVNYFTYLTLIIYILLKYECLYPIFIIKR